MINKPIRDVVKSDIETLVLERIPEGKRIEYKQQVPGNSDDDKRELLKDISAFANSEGGDLIFGIEEERDANGQSTGVPVSAPGLTGNMDAEKLRIESVIRDGIAPRLLGVELVSIDGFPEGPVLLVRVPKSQNSPHQVTFRNLARFFGRGSAGTYQLDVNEIAAAFGSGNNLGTQIEEFRKDRVESFKTGNTAMPMAAGPKFIVHLCPELAFQGSEINIQRLTRRELSIPPLYTSGWNTRANLEGCLTHNSDGGSKPCTTYAQVYRSGIVEFVEAGMFYDGSRQIDGRIPSQLFERAIVAGVSRAVAVYRELGVEAPIEILVALIDVRGFTMTGDPGFSDDCRYIDRDDLEIPKVRLNSLDASIPGTLRPVFDTIWQACGFPDSLNYTESGVWNVRTIGM